MGKPKRGATGKSDKARVFVGSSVESLPYAYAIQENLDPHDAYVKVWSQGVFNIAAYGLESLLDTVRSHDFAVFVFAADDQVISRNQKHKAVRDNVILELGLFMGALGRERTFVIAPMGVDLHLPTDLWGWNVVLYDPSRDRKDLVAAVGVACNRIRMAIQRLGSFRPGSPPEHVSSFGMITQAPPPFATIKTTGFSRKAGTDKDAKPSKFKDHLKNSIPRRGIKFQGPKGISKQKSLKQKGPKRSK
jgi:hypothetical protein